MKIDETTLLAYLDGQLSPEDVRQVDQAINQDDHLKTTLQALRASALPYQQAYSAQKLPALPQALAAQLDQAVINAQQTQEDLQRSTDQPPASTRRHWLQAAVAAVAGLGVGIYLQPMIMGSATESSSDWIVAAASYHAMYTPETLAGDAQATAASLSTTQKFAQRAGKPVKVPDLSGYGWQLKRVQLLKFREQAVLQIAYLSSSGLPGALCVAHQPQASASERVQSKQHHGVQTAKWRADSLEYVWISDDTASDNLRVAQAISSHQAPLISALS
jgi:anti-sigma factor RsiW